MSRSRITFLVVSLLLVVPMLAATFVYAADRGKPDEKGDSLFKYIGVFTEVLNLVRQTYVDETDMNSLMASALDGTTEALDAFSQYVPAAAVSRYLEVQKVGTSRSGLHLVKDNGIVYVVAIDADGPAKKAGVQLGDIVVEAAGKDAHRAPFWEIEETFAGEPGTKIPLRLLRLGETRVVTCELAEFSPPAPSLERVEGLPVLHLPSFGERTAWTTRGLLAKGKTEERLIIDLRGIAGGDPEAAYAVARLFTQGDLGALVGRKGQISTFTAGEAPVWKGSRLVVLVDRGTLGAAELLTTILAQKLQAEIVGERTFGYAGRLASADLSSGGRLIYTDAFYAGPDRKPLNAALQPDVQVDERSRTFEDKDTPLDDLILKQGLRRLVAELEAAKKAA
ncbi:MAG TPA: S41 family peptidase [Thermoanaerobaculia bacterium]|nr:S41 family peptidase [Thermoanaerobaculia bacterium]